MSNSHGIDDFVRMLTGVQRELYIYILSLVPNDSQASDVLQNTNLVLWQKRDEFQPGTNFSAWAVTIAYYQVLADRKRRTLDRHLFNDDLMADVAAAATETAADADSRLGFLEECLKLLSANHRSVLLRRYAPGGQVEAIATAEGRTPASMSQLLYRIRRSLMECIERKLATEVR